MPALAGSSCELRPWPVRWITPADPERNEFGLVRAASRKEEQ
jgi:hypothetical protein